MPSQETTDQKAASVQQPTLRAVPMGLFPRMSSLQDVVDLAKSKMPVEYHNDMLALLYTYHNTLLEEIKNEVRL